MNDIRVSLGLLELSLATDRQLLCFTLVNFLNLLFPRMIELNRTIQTKVLRFDRLFPPHPLNILLIDFGQM